MAYQCVEVITNLTEITCNDIEEFYRMVYYAGSGRQDIIGLILDKCDELGASTDIVAAIESYSSNPDIVEEFDRATQKMTRTKTYPDKFTHDTMHEWTELTFPSFQGDIRFSVERISEGEVV